jgi:hypothetical protein
VTAAEAGPAARAPADSISRPGTRPALVIGAGPAGLAVAACLGEAGIAADLVDRRGAPGGAFLGISPETRLLSLASHLGLPGLPCEPGSLYTTAGAYRAYLGRYAEHHGLAPRSSAVSSVERHGDRFEARFDGELSAGYSAVVVATGIFDHPVLPDIPGLYARTTGPEVIHAREYTSAKARAARRVLVLGAGVSAVQIAEGCATSGIPVTLSSRRPVRTYPQRLLGVDLNNLAYHLTAWVPANVLCRVRRGSSSLPSVDGGFRRLRRSGRIDLRGPITAVTPRGAVFADGAAVEFDLIVLATGYRYLTPFLPPEVERTRDGLPRMLGGESVSWPGLYFAGLECGLTLSGGTLRGIAKDAPLLARRVAARVRALGAEAGR